MADYEFWASQNDGAAAVVIYDNLLQTLWQQIEELANKTDPYRPAINAEEYLALEAGRTVHTLTDDNRIDYEGTKARVDILDYVARHTEVKKSGSTFRARCPLPGHDEKTASFYIYPHNQSWFCFGACHKGGDIFDFWKAMFPNTPYPDELTSSR